MDSQREKNHSLGSVTNRSYASPHCRLLVEIDEALIDCQIYARQIVLDYINEYFVDLRNILL